MPEMKDIAETDLELEDDAEGEGGADDAADDDKGQSGLDKSTAQELAKTMQGLTQTLQKVAAPGASAASKADIARDYLLKKGFKQEDLADLQVFVASMVEDATAAQDEKLQKDRIATFRQTVFEKGLEEADKFFESVGIKNPTQNMRAALVNDAGEIMRTNPKFKNALEAFQQGRVPLTSDFVKAIHLAGTVYGRGGATMKDSSSKGASSQLDTRNSRTKPASDAANAKGEVDLNSLTDVEREIYVNTLNVTKNKDIALHALKTIAPKLK